MPFELSEAHLGAILLVAWLGSWLVVGLFACLNTFTRRRHFSIWTCGWIFHALWLTLQFHAHAETLPAIRFAQLFCMAASMCCLLLGSARFFGRPASEPTIGMFLVFLACWAWIGPHEFTSALTVELPLFALVGATGIATGIGFMKRHLRSRNPGNGLAALGFTLWGLQLIGFPFFRNSAELEPTGYLLAATIQWFIASSMIVLTLEETRNQKRALSRSAAGSDRRYRRLFDQVRDGVVIADSGSLQILEINRAAAERLGMTDSEARHLRLDQFFAPVIASCDRPPASPGDWFRHIVRHRHLHLVWKDGTPVPTEIAGASVDYRGRSAFQFILRERPLVNMESPRKADKGDGGMDTPSKTQRRPARILVLDDERALAEMVSEMLSMQGDQPKVAHDAREALSLIEHGSFDAILSDFRMPQIDGRELLRILRDDHPGQARKLIYLTGDVVNDETREFLKNCGQPFLTKPFQFDTVKRAIEDIIAQGAGPDAGRQISTAA